MRIVWNSNHIKMQYNRFEEKLRERLAGAEMQPSPMVWSNIRNQIQPPSPKGSGQWKWIILLIIGLVGGGSSFYHYQNSHSSIANPPQNTAQVRKVVKGIHTEVSPQSPVTQSPATPNAQKNTIPSDLRTSKRTSINSNPLTPKSEIANRKDSEESFAESKENKGKSSRAIEKTTSVSILPPSGIPSAKSALSPETQNLAVETKEIQQNPNEIVSTPPIKLIELGEEKKITLIVQQNQHSLSTKNLNHEKEFSQLPPINAEYKKNSGGGWSTMINGGLSMIAYQSFYTNDNGRALSPLSVNTVGIATISVSGDSAQAVNVEDIQVFNEVTSGNFDAEYIKMTVSPVTYFIGTGVSRKLSPKMSFDAGIKLHYQQTRRIILPTKNVANYYQAVYNSKNSISTIKGKKENNFDFYVMELPLMINYDFPVKKSRSAFSAGMGASYRLLMNGMFADNSPIQNGNTLISRNTYTVYQEHNFSANMRLMYQFHLNEKTGIYIAGNTQALVKPMYNRSISFKTPILFGLETGVRF